MAYRNGFRFITAPLVATRFVLSSCPTPKMAFPRLSRYPASWDDETGDDFLFAEPAPSRLSRPVGLLRVPSSAPRDHKSVEKDTSSTRNLPSRPHGQRSRRGLPRG